MQWLKQSTAVTVKIGPFLDSTDGNTAETGLTISQADVRLSKNGGDIAQKSDATSCTHDELGIYGCPLDTTDTNTLGRLQLWVHESGALAVWHEYMVVTANVYDSFCSTDVLNADVTQIGGDTQSATDLKDFADAGYDPATNKVQGLVLCDTTTTNTDMITTAQVNAEVDTALADVDLDHFIQVTAGAEEPTDGSYLDQIMHKAGTQDFDAATDSLEAIRDNQAGADAAAIADAVWDEAIADHTNTAQFGGEVQAHATVAEVNSEVDTALADVDLDHLIQVTAGVEEPTDGSYLDQIMHAGAGQTFDATTDSLEALRNRGDAAWITATGFSTHSAAEVWTVGTRALTDKAGFSLAADQSAVTIGTVTDVTNDVGITQAGADKAWSTSTRALTDKVDFALSSAGIDSVWDEVIEGTLTVRQALRLTMSMLASESSGGGTTTLVYRDYGDTKDRLTFTVDANGNRSAVVRDAT